MEIIDAIESRRSIRAYLNKPVYQELIHKIIETALRSPSATNIQPWNLYVVSGEVLEKLRKDNVDNFLSGGKPTFEEPLLEDIYKLRRSEVARDLFAILGIQREDKDKRAAWAARGHAYFDAPTAIILAVDSSILSSTWALLGVGSLIQTIALTSLEYGLGTCISEQGVSYHDIIRKHINIPESQQIIISIAMGYPDYSAPANQLCTKRATVEDVVHWFGF